MIAATDPGVVTRRMVKNEDARGLMVGEHVVVWHWDEDSPGGHWYKGMIVAKDPETPDRNRPIFKIFYEQEEWKKKE